MNLPGDKKLSEIELLAKSYRKKVESYLRPLILSYYPQLIKKDDNEYRKMIELSTKMSIVGKACTEIAGQEFSARHQLISALYGGSCFLADSFIDDFGNKTAKEYLQRFELLLTKGWFDIKSEREQLLYIFLSRLFAERDVFDPMLRQAIFSLFVAQKRDVELRINAYTYKALTRPRKLSLLKNCARDRGGHTIITLLCFLVPDFPLQYYHSIFTAGTLFMYIDDHGDFYPDLYGNRITYMNQVKHPAQILSRIFNKGISTLIGGLPENSGRNIMTDFLIRYFITRLKKHSLLKTKGELSWAVYE